MELFHIGWVAILAALVSGFILGLLAAWALGVFQRRQARELAETFKAQAEAEKKEALDAFLETVKATFGDLSLQALSRSTGELLKIARLDGSYTKVMAKISKFKLLLLDDFGVTPLKPDEINDLFEVIEERTLSGSIIITAQLPIKEWHTYLGNETIADAMMDRLIHTAHRIELSGDSMRKLLADI